MREVSAAIGKAFAVGAVCLVPGFSGSTAFARPVVLDCPNDGSHYLGSCIDDNDCLMKCRTAHPDIPPQDIQGRCRNGCCTCLF